MLVLNSGSSSVKFALLHPGNGERVVGGLAEEIGTPEAVLHVQRGTADPVTEKLTDGSYQAVISWILGHLPESGPRPDRRRPPGGPRRRPVHRVVLVDAEVIAAIRSFSHLAPLHNPKALAGIEAVRAARPGLPQVAAFDTAFHH